MRRPLVLIVALLAVVAGIIPAAAEESTLAQVAPGVGGFMSSNISYVGTLLSDSSGVGARVHVMPDGERRFYVSGAQGLSIYNIDNPALPVLIGAVRDPELRERGRQRLRRRQDRPDERVHRSTRYYYVFHASDPIGPLGQVTITMGDAPPLSAAHIVDCIDDACDYFYGSDGHIYDARQVQRRELVARLEGRHRRDQTGQLQPRQRSQRGGRGRLRPRRRPATPSAS